MASTFIDITDHDKLRNLLMGLDPGTVPHWGKMKPQQMIEHLIDQVRYTNGKQTPVCNRSAEEAARGKQQMIYTDAEIPKNIFLKEPPEHFEYPDIETAINQLMKELEGFDQYFKQPGVTVIHGGFGPLDHKEWLIWHGKHFTHHLKQFDLIPASI